MSIFVSYSRLDEQVVKALALGLEAANREVWFDHDLGGGEVWWVKILESIRQAEVVIFALSDNSLRSKPCRAELDYALALDRPVLPIKVGPVANFRSNPLSELQTIEFREQDAFSAFEIIAAVDIAAKRLQPLPQVLPPEPQIPFAYLVSLSKQIDNGELSPQAQIDAVDELRKAFREETDSTVHDDILAILRNLKLKPWATVQAASEVDAVLAWADGHRRKAGATGATASSDAGPNPGTGSPAPSGAAQESEQGDQSGTTTEEPGQQPGPTGQAGSTRQAGSTGQAGQGEKADKAQESQIEAERRSRANFAENMARAVKIQQEKGAAGAAEGQAGAPRSRNGAPPAPEHTWTRPAARPQPDEPVHTFRGVSQPLTGGRGPSAPESSGQVPHYFAQQPPAQQPPPMAHTAHQPAGAGHPSSPLPVSNPPTTPRPSPHWGWSTTGLLFSVGSAYIALFALVFGFLALYYSLRVGQRYTSGDVAGAQRASTYARAWGVVGLVVGTLLLISQFG